MNNKVKSKILGFLVIAIVLALTYLFFQLKTKPALEQKAIQERNTIERTFTVDEK